MSLSSNNNNNDIFQKIEKVDVDTSNNTTDNDSNSSNKNKCLELDIVSYEDFCIHNDSVAIAKLDNALLTKGIVGMYGIPQYTKKVCNYITAIKHFMSLPENIKAKYAPSSSSLSPNEDDDEDNDNDNNSSSSFLGYEKGKEKFQRPEDGSWVIDDLKNSYYVHVPDTIHNKWPDNDNNNNDDINLKSSCLELGQCMSDIGTQILDKMGVFDIEVIIDGDDDNNNDNNSSNKKVNNKKIDISNVPRVARMLYYSKNTNTHDTNPYWCGAHYDHGVFTVLIPAKYYNTSKEEVAQPYEAGLYVKPHNNNVSSSDNDDDGFRKVTIPTNINPNDVMMFQVGEFGQLITNDKLRATEHRVQKPNQNYLERYTMALFFDIPKDTIIQSKSVLTSDSRYGGKPNIPCSYEQWTKRSFERYSVD